MGGKCWSRSFSRESLNMPWISLNHRLGWNLIENRDFDRHIASSQMTYEPHNSLPTWDIYSLQNTLRFSKISRDHKGDSIQNVKVWTLDGFQKLMATSWGTGTKHPTKSVGIVVHARWWLLDYHSLLHQITTASPIEVECLCGSRGCGKPFCMASRCRGKWMRQIWGRLDMAGWHGDVRSKSGRCKFSDVWCFISLVVLDPCFFYWKLISTCY